MMSCVSSLCGPDRPVHGKLNKFSVTERQAKGKIWKTTTSSRRRSVSVALGIQPKDKLLLAFGDGTNLQRHTAHEIVAGLGPDKASSFPVLHTFATRLCTVSGIA